MDYYKLMNEHYSTNHGISDDISSLQGLIGDLINQGYLSYDAMVDGLYNKQMLIYEHIDPIEGKSNDMRAICLDKDNIHWGNVIDTQDGRYFMSVTKADWNGAYNKYKIRELTDAITFTVDTTVNMKCVIANKGFYDEISYVNDTTVFEDKDTRATIVQYNPKTSQLTLFDDVFVNNQHYKIVKIDNYTLKEYDEDFGVLQMVIVDTPFGEIIKNKVDSVKGIVMTARVKDKILNSVSRELRCYHNIVKRGDYVDFKYKAYEDGDVITETYLIVNKPTMSSEGYSTSLMYLCESKMNLLNAEGDVVNVDVYFENNRMRIDKTSDSEFIKFANSSYMISVQTNETTLLRCRDLERIIVDGKPYTITGTDSNSKGIISIGLNSSQFDTNDDNIELGIANYNSQMEEINKVNPPTPSGSIMGADELCKGYAEEYYLQGAGTGVTWSVDCSYIQFTQDGTKCSLYFNTLSDANKSFILKARYGTSEFTKTITTKRL